MAIDVTTTETTTSTILFLPQTQKIVGGKVLGLEKKIVYCTKLSGF